MSAWPTQIAVHRATESSGTTFLKTLQGRHPRKNSASVKATPIRTRSQIACRQCLMCARWDTARNDLKDSIAREIDATQNIDRYALPLERSVTRAHSSLTLPAGWHGFRTSTLHCDHCRGELSLSIQRYWHMQFCCSACVTAYLRRLAPETKLKICRLEISPLAI